MILKRNEMKISDNFKAKEPSISITKKDIANLNNKIKKDIAQNDTEYQKGLINATFSNNKDREL